VKSDFFYIGVRALENQITKSYIEYENRNHLDEL